MPSKPNERQYRTLTATLAPLKRADEGGEEPKKRFDSDYYVEGYASTFNDPYPIYCDFAGNEYLEIISPDAFREADMSDVILQYDHEGRVYARTSNGTLLIEPDEHGLFTVAADELDRETRTTTITRVKKVFDVSAVSLPADPNTEISARNLLNGEIEQTRKEFARRRMTHARACAVMAIANARKKG